MKLQAISKTKSQALFTRAQELIPGGVNSPVRAFKSVGGEPLFIKRAKGPYIWDEDDNQFIDFVGSWGPMILGHADADIESAVVEVLHHGASFGAPTAIENEMATEVIKLVPSIEKVRMVNSGTEAVMSAIRLARAYTTRTNLRKNKIIKFSGCYHGHVDPLLVSAGSGVATLSLPDSPGVVEDVVKSTIVVPYNSVDAVLKVFEQYGEEISAIILEPVVGNAGCILPEPGFLEFLRKICDEYSVLLIFDEVMTGFRVALGGAQEKYKVMPDITTLGKVIGGGLPVGAYGARKEIMSLVAPEGSMYQAGTLSGNPLAMAAGLTCLRKIQAPGFYEELEAKVKYLGSGLLAAAAKSSNPMISQIQFNHSGGMFGFFFSKEQVTNYEIAKANIDSELFKNFYLAMLDEGVYFAPSAFEAGFMSAAHSYEDLDKVIAAFASVIKLF